MPISAPKTPIMMSVVVPELGKCPSLLRPRLAKALF
jgi:hypothetical protein